MELECKKCGYEWDYQGQSDYYATCPNCHYKVNIPAQAEVTNSDDKKEHHREEVSAEVKVVHPNEENHRFNNKENQLIKEITQCDDSEEMKEVISKYDQVEYNVLKKKIKDKANRIRNDLRLFERVENVLESSNWKYSEL